MSTGRPKRKSIKYAESSDEEPELKKPKNKPVKKYENDVIILNNFVINCCPNFRAVVKKKIESSDDEPELKKPKVKAVKKFVDIYFS